MQASKIKYIKSLGEQETLDFEVDSPDHNFYADGMVASNSHAVSYSLLSIYTVYFKFNHPKEFFLALLEMSMKEPKPHEEIEKISMELPSFGIELLPPDLLKSEVEFSIEGNNIRYGISAIKGLAGKVCSTIQSFAKEYDNKFDLFAAAKQSGINVGALSAMIQAGALDSIVASGKDRAWVVLEAQVFNLLTDWEKQHFLMMGKDFGYDLFAMIKHFFANKTVGKDGKTQIIKKTRWKDLGTGKGRLPMEQGGTIQKKSIKYLEIYQRNKKNLELANWFFEKELLGFSYSTSLFDVLIKQQPNLIRISDLDVAGSKHAVYLCGSANNVKNKKSKSGKAMMTFDLTDSDAGLKCIFFDQKLTDWQDKNQSKVLEDGNIVLCKGRQSKEGDALFLDNIAILDNRAYLKLRDLK